jgi:uncharacterized membrane protein YkoI
MRWLRFVVIALVLFATITPAVGRPRISIADASKIALARVPGTIVHEKQKKKKKKDKVVYNIKIEPRDKHRAGYVEKVEIDGDNGKIIKIKEVKAKAAKPEEGDDD